MLIQNRKIKSIFILSILIFTIFSLINPSSKSIQLYNANIILDVDWNLETAEIPIIPRDEIKELDLLIKFSIVSDEFIGKGAYIGYAKQGISAFNKIEVVESSPWCHAVLERNLVPTNLSEYEEAKVKLFLTLDENAPAFGDGYIKIKASCEDLGLIKGFEGIFVLTFSPSYLPIIKLNLPHDNTISINPDENAVFPLEFENAGNARTKVYLDIVDIPEGWNVTVSEVVILNEEIGSKATAYLTVIPPNQFGYHNEDVSIKVKITPVQAENENEVGNPLYASFIIQNRGFSTSGLEFYLIIFIIIIIVLALLMIIFRKKHKREKLT